MAVCEVHRFEGVAVCEVYGCMGVLNRSVCGRVWFG